MIREMTFLLQISRKIWQDDAELYHTEMVEKICDLDDDLMMQYLEGEEPSVDEYEESPEKGNLRVHRLVPVCCGTAYREQGYSEAP